MRHFVPLILFSIGAALFWLAEFAYQYFAFAPQELSVSLVRSFAFAGTTLIGAALFSSALFKWIPVWAQYWRYRRYLGVSGFALIIGHVWSVYHFYFNYNLRVVYWNFNPITNPLVFGSIALILFFAMAATSTDSAVQLLTPKNWKRLHRVVYIAYWAAIFHFILTNPALLKNPAGYLLLAVTAAALFGQGYWFMRIASRKHFISWGALIGIGMILLYSTTGLYAYDMLYGQKKEPSFFYAFGSFCSSRWSAITLPPVGIFICQSDFNDEGIRRHELVHWEQYRRMSTIGFYVRYLTGWVVAGFRYTNNWMEQEARMKSAL